MQFHTRDWLDSKELRRCSPEARGLLADIMALAHEGYVYGFLSDALGALTVAYMANRCHIKPAAFVRMFAELEANTRIEKRGGLYCVPRMVRDEEIRASRAGGGHLGGNPKLKIAKQGYPSTEPYVQPSTQPSLEINSRERAQRASGSVSESGFEFTKEKNLTLVGELSSESIFPDWWQMWSKVRGTHNSQLALQAWISAVPMHLESAAVECTASYLASLDNPAKGFNPHTFIFEQAKERFEARWPAFASRNGPQRAEGVTERAIRVAKERVLRTGRL